jgi:hypothetical protein
LTHTRYSGGNIVLLCIGGVLCLFGTWLIVMTSGFGYDPLPGFRGFCGYAFFWIAVLMLPAFLILLRWSSLGAAVMWGITACSAVLAILRWAHLFDLVFFPFVLSLIASKINSRSEQAV